MSVPLGMSFEDRFKGGISDHFVMSKANKYEVCMIEGTYLLHKNVQNKRFRNLELQCTIFI